MKTLSPSFILCLLLITIPSFALVGVSQTCGVPQVLALDNLTGSPDAYVTYSLVIQNTGSEPGSITAEITDCPNMISVISPFPQVTIPPGASKVYTGTFKLANTGETMIERTCHVTATDGCGKSSTGPLNVIVFPVKQCDMIDTYTCGNNNQLSLCGPLYRLKYITTCEKECVRGACVLDADLCRADICASGGLALIVHRNGTCSCGPGACNRCEIWSVESGKCVPKTCPDGSVCSLLSPEECLASCPGGYAYDKEIHKCTPGAEEISLGIKKRAQDANVMHMMYIGGFLAIIAVCIWVYYKFKKQ